jgi:TRAP transporter TAXI family solute receptor
MHVMGMIGALVFLAATPVAAQDVVGFGTLPPGSMANAMMNAIVKVVSTKENLHSVVQPHAGSTQYLPLLNRGELDFANTNALDAHFAKQGIEIFTIPNANLRMATVIYPLRQQLLVRKDSGIKSFADLKGKRLVGGYQAQRSVQVLLDGCWRPAGSR